MIRYCEKCGKKMEVKTDGYYCSCGHFVPCASKVPDMDLRKVLEVERLDI